MVRLRAELGDCVRVDRAYDCCVHRSLLVPSVLYVLLPTREEAENYRFAVRQLQARNARCDHFRFHLDQLVSYF